MSKIKVKIAHNSDLENWDTIVDQSQGGTIFHKLNWLRAAEKESNSKLIPLIGYQRQHVIFLLPVFFRKIAGFKLLFSPPPRCLIPEMGLILRVPTNKQHAIETHYFNSVEAIGNYINNKLRPDFVRMKNGVHLNDIRPFLWAGYQTRPNYTYHIPLIEGQHLLFSKMQSNARNEIRRNEKYPHIQIVDGTYQTYMQIIKLVRERYRQQNLHLPGSDKYFQNIYNSLNGSNLYIKAVRKNNQILTGIILLKYKDIIRFWVGGITPKEDLVGLNERLHWEIIKEYSEKGFTNYDLVGANTKHLCNYKAKFNPDLKLYFEIEKRTIKGHLFEYIYNRYKKAKQ